MLMSTLRREAAGERVLYADFKFVAGLPSRYHEAGCPWMFDRKQAGGGTLVNLGVHFIDLFQCLTSTVGTRLDAASFAALQREGDVEDYVTLTLRNGDRIGRVETAYLYPAPAGIFDMLTEALTIAHDEALFIPLHQQPVAWAMKSTIDVPQFADEYVRLWFAQMK